MTNYPKDDSGQIQVDFVWGNFPLQPDELRGGEGQSETLDPTLDNHSIAINGYANYPSFIPNYDGIVQYDGSADNFPRNIDSQNDEDPDDGLEFVVPTLLRKTIEEADDLLAQYQVGTWATAHYLTASYIESTAKVVRVTAWDTEYANWSNTANEALNGLRVGDEVDLSALTDTEDPAVTLGLGVVKVTKVNNDGDASWFEFKTATALEIDKAAAGTVYAGPNLVNIITVVRPNRGAGTIQNVDGQGIPVRYFGTD